MTRSNKLLALFMALLVGALVAPGARADDASELERAKASYDAGRYAEGVDHFRQLLDPNSPMALRDPVAIERARAYYAACLIALDRNAEADAQIEAIIRADPLYTPDPVIFPGKVVNRVLDIKVRLKSEIEKAVQARADAERAQKLKQQQEQQAYIEALQQLAAQESVVVRHSRWIAGLPFGIGQFQNGQDGLGYVFLVSESALALTSIIAGAIHMRLVAQYAVAPSTFNFQDFDSRRQASQAVSIYSGIALAAVAAGGILQAQLNFVPEVRETRQRPLPRPPTAIAPAAFASGSGWMLGVSGRF